MENSYANTKQNNEHYMGKVWVTKGYKTRLGNNICVDRGQDELYVISFVPKVTERAVINAIKSMGWNVKDWL